MKKIFGIIISLLFLISCTQQKETYLYEEGSAEENLAKAMFAVQCQSENVIFENLATTTTIPKIFESQTKFIYKIERKLTENSTDVTKKVYVLIEKINDSTMAVSVSHEETTPKNGLPKLFKFEYSAANNTDLINTVKVGVCSADKLYARSSSWNEEFITFSDTRKSSTTTPYTQRDDSMTLRTSFANIVEFFKMKQVYTSNDGTTTTTWTYDTGSSTEISQTTCDQDSVCLSLSSASTSCAVSIDTSHYSSSNPDNVIINFTGC